MTAHLQGGGFEKWLAELGITDAPLTRQGLATALQFFHAFMPTLPRAGRVSFLKGIDLHKPVRRTDLLPSTIVAAFRKCNEDPFKLFYTKAGTGLNTLGVNTANRQFHRYQVRTRVAVLESRCAAARDTWTDTQHHVIASGGGLQYIIPQSFNALELVR